MDMVHLPNKQTFWKMLLTKKGSMLALLQVKNWNKVNPK